MNILICNNRYFPSSGPETYLFALTALLERHGHTVVPLSAAYAQTVDTPYRRYFVPPPVDADSLYFKQYAQKLSPAGKAALVARATYYRPARQAAERAIREQKIDLVYLLNTANVLSPSLIDAAHACGVPCAMFLCDYNLLCPAYHFLRDGHICQDCLGGYSAALRHRCLQHSLAVTSARVIAMTVHNLTGVHNHVNAFIAPSRFLAKQMELHFPPAKGRVSHIPNFADESLLASGNANDATTGAGRERMAPDGERPYVLCYGRLSPEKGFEVALRAFAGLDRPVDLVIAGDDSGNGYRFQLEALAAELGLSNVYFPGFQRGEALANLIRGAVCVVVPSIWHDNSPNTVFESMAYSKAIIGSDLGGISEQLEEGAGIVVPPQDPEALRTALRRVVDDPELRARLGAAACARAHTEYAPERHYARLMPVFEAAVAEGARRR